MTALEPETVDPNRGTLQLPGFFPGLFHQEVVAWSSTTSTRIPPVCASRHDICPTSHVALMSPGQAYNYKHEANPHPGGLLSGGDGPWPFTRARHRSRGPHRPQIVRGRGAMATPTSGTTIQP
jgi:hypothetical protein